MRKTLLIASLTFIGGYLIGFIPQKRDFIKLSDCHKADLVRLNNTMAELGKVKKERDKYRKLTEEMKKDNNDLREQMTMDDVIFGRVRY